MYRGGGNIPIGYNYDKGKLTVNPYEAEQVRKIYEWYLNGESLGGISKRLHEAGYTNRYSSWNSWTSIRNILSNEIYTGQLHFGGVIIENAHEAIISKEQFNMAQVIRTRRQEKYGATAFQSKHLLTGLLFCGYCGARYYRKDTGRYFYYMCYSRSKQILRMVKDPNCKNRTWKAEKLESLVAEKVRELLRSPKMAEDIAAARKPKTVIPARDAGIEKRIKEIDRQIGRLMELYQLDNIPYDILSENINKLYNEKTALQASIEPAPADKTLPFDIVQELIADASQIWDFADIAQKRRILQSLIRKITLTGDDIQIAWTF